MNLERLNYSKIYKILFLLIFISMFFSDFILVKQAGILGQIGVIFAFFYSGIFLIETFVMKLNYNFLKQPILILITVFLIAIVIGFIISPLSYSLTFKGEVVYLKFLKQFLSIIIWVVFGAITFHFMNLYFKKEKRDLNKVFKIIFITYYSLVSIGIVEWILYIFKPAVQLKFSSIFHHFFKVPYANVYSWFIDYPRFRLVEGEPVHGSIALELFFILFVIGILYTKYKKISMISLVLSVTLVFLTFSRSAYLAIWLMIALLLFLIIYRWRVLIIPLIFKFSIIGIFLLQTILTFPFLNDSIYKYYHEKFDYKENVIQSTVPNNVDKSDNITNYDKVELPDQNISQSEMSNNTRGISALISIDMLKDYPLTGVGWGLYGFHFNDYFKHYKNISGDNWEFKMYQDGNNQYFWPEQHSFILRLISETGILGTVLFIILIGYIYFPALRLLPKIWTFAPKMILFIILAMSLVILMQQLAALSGMNLLYIPFTLGMAYFISRNFSGENSMFY